MLRRTIAVSAASLSVMLVLSSCSGSKNPSSSSASSTPPASSSSASSPASSSSSSAAASALFGPGCSTLGLTDAALAPAAQAPVGTVAAGVPFLSNVVAAANAGGLTATLNAAPALTVFAPVDDAFKKEPPAQLQALLTDPKQKAVLVATLKYHVLGQTVTKADLAGKHKTLEGAQLEIAGTGDSYTVNGTAKILCGGIQTKNAVVYLVDTVLHPAS